MKKVVLSFIFLICLGLVTVINVSAEGEATEANPPVEELDILKNVVGQVRLYASRARFPKELEALFAGDDKKLTAGRKPKLINVEGLYDGDFKVELNEKNPSSKGAYQFRIPVPTVIIEYASQAKWRAKKYGNVNASFSGETSIPVPSLGSAFDSFELESIQNTSHAISISKIIAKRKGNQAILTGEFKKGSAVGRFKLKFTP